MRLLHNAAAAAVTVLALYFVLVWGADAVRVFTSSTYGLDEFAHAQDVFSIGAALQLDADGLFRVAAFLAAFKLVGAVAFALHLVDRARAFAADRASEHEMLEAALLLVLLLVLVISLPAVMQHDERLLRADGLALLLGSLTAMLNVHERRIRALLDANTAEFQPGPRQRALEAEQAATSVKPRLALPEPLRRIAAAAEPFFRLWTYDLRASAAGDQARGA